MPASHLINIVILAAGQGTRMKSALPKVLHPLAGMPLLQHVINTAKNLSPEILNVVYGHGGEKVMQTIDDAEINWIHQVEQLGTGHAVAQATDHFEDGQVVLVLYGDVPLIRMDTLADLLNRATDGIALLTVHLENPQGYGRIVRNKQAQIVNITEEKDASDEIKKIHEVNTGIMAVKAELFKKWLANLDNNNAQNEFYLTDVIEMAVKDNLTVHSTQPDNEFEVMGINSREQLAELERRHQMELAKKFMAQGVTFSDPARVDFRGNINFDQDVIVDVNVIFEGTVTIAANVRIGANCIIRNCIIEENTEILPMSVLENAKIGRDSRVGPFARLRPGAELAESTHVGNFVEIKNSQIGKGSKVNHLTYVGDSVIGKNVNIGAGTITCNYDGANKHKTIIEDNVFVGSATQLVAPVKIGKNVTIGAGSTITSDVADDELVLSRVKQKSVKGWKRPTKNN